MLFLSICESLIVQDVYQDQEWISWTIQSNWYAKIFYINYYKDEKISAPRGNSFWEIVYGSPFICVLNILVGLFTHILIYLFIWSLVFSYGEDPYDIQPANSIQTILYCFIVISHLFHTLKFSIWTITTTWICTRRV